MKYAERSKSGSLRVFLLGEFLSESLQIWVEIDRLLAQ